ncbi:copper chaperone PCu(A)C [Reinekea sp.]|jgi:copper(I)-binding protein|uniref:copper chaperone PCu(A)C n=1 Tax=Reinekea sp. TaxID=1970455 RepID=UPI0039894973
MKLSHLFVGALISAVAIFASAHTHDNIMIESPWARASAPGAPSAGFLVLHNHDDTDDTLLKVEGDFAKKLELHKSFEENGVMRMVEQKDGILIPSHGMVTLAPGGYHLMFMGLEKNFEVGEVYTVVLTFEHGGERTVELEVKEMADMAEMKMSH